MFNQLSRKANFANRCPLCGCFCKEPLVIERCGWCNDCFDKYGKEIDRKAHYWEAATFGDRTHYIPANKEAAKLGFLAGFEAGLRTKLKRR